MVLKRKEGKKTQTKKKMLRQYKTITRSNVMKSGSRETQIDKIGGGLFRKA